MKNKSILYLAAIVLLASCSAKMNIAFTSTKTVPYQDNNPAVVAGGTVNAKVLKSFARVYGEIPAAKWYTAGNGFMVKFNLNNIDNTIYYQTNGSVDAALHYYAADQLSPAIREKAQAALPNYSLFHVVEVNKNGVTAYYVKMQDATTIKTLKIVGEEWEVLETIVKR